MGYVVTGKPDKPDVEEVRCVRVDLIGTTCDMMLETYSSFSKPPLSLEHEADGVPIDSKGLNLPSGGRNDGEYWINLPNNEDERNFLKNGDIESVELYIHGKPALGGTFTDIVMRVFCLFNGPATIKASLVNIELSKIGEHVGDWEHYTLRVSNFTGELWSMYFSEHSGGEWVNTCNLEYLKRVRVINEPNWL
ncbi:hypothetical protein ACSBR1_007124 [Camellia fascicularis]